jgi:hypothetical protein
LQKSCGCESGILFLPVLQTKMFLLQHRSNGDIAWQLVCVMKGIKMDTQTWLTIAFFCCGTAMGILLAVARKWLDTLPPVGEWKESERCKELKQRIDEYFREREKEP